MAKLNYNRPNNGYEMEPWAKRRYKNQTTDGAGKDPWAKRRYKNQTQPTALNKTINQESVFISGKYWNTDIGQVINQDPSYCEWVLANQPRGIVAQQIIKYFNKNQDFTPQYQSHKSGKITGTYTTPTHNFDGSPVDFTQPPF